MAQTQRNTRTENNKDEGEVYQELPEPVLVQGYFKPEKGATISGVILEREESKWVGEDGRPGSPVYKIRTNKTCKHIKDRDNREASRTLPAGSIVGVNETAKLAQLQKFMLKGPVSVEIVVNGPGEKGRGWDMTVRHRMAF